MSAVLCALFALMWSGPPEYLAAQEFTNRPTGDLASGSPVRVGLLVPLSGPRKRLGEAVLEAATLAQVETGGPQLVVMDTKGTVDGARAAVEALAADPAVIGVIGPIGWRVAAAAGQRAEELQLPLLGLAAREGLEQQGAYVFRGRLSIEEQARWMAQVAVQQLQVERVAVLYPDDALGRRASRAFFEEVRGLHGRVTAWASYSAGETNLNTSVEELVAKRQWVMTERALRRRPKAALKRRRERARVDFDAIFIPDYDDGVVLGAKFLRFHDVPLQGLGDGSTVQVLGTSHLRGPRLADAEGLLAGALYPEVYQSGRGSQTAQAWALRFEEEFQRAPGSLDAKVYDLYAMLALVARAGQTKLGGEEGIRGRIPKLLVEMEPYMGLAGQQWFEADGSPGHKLEIWVVDAAGEVGSSY